MTEEVRGQLSSMETLILAIILVIIISTMNIACFYIGASVRQKVDKGETVKMPNLNPTDLYHEHQRKQEQEKKMKQREVLLRNIENYDGTPYGQEEIPR